MPKGVEHINVRRYGRMGEELELPQMPKGVEHSAAFAMRPRSLAGITSDAERR